jgi:hypothetical protein
VEIDARKQIRLSHLKSERFIRKIGYFSNAYPSINGHVVCGRLTKIANDNMGFSDPVVFPNETSPFHANIGPQLPLGGIFSYLDGSFGGFSAFYGCVSGIPVEFQRIQDGPDADRAQNDLGKRSPEHPLGPLRHIALGAKIFGVVVSFFGGILLSAHSLKRTSRALDDAFDGVKLGWLRLCGWLAGFVGGAFVASGCVVYILSVYG